jgi:hypothetical protein
LCLVYFMFPISLDCPFTIKKHNTIYFGHHQTQDTRRWQAKQKTQHNWCWTPPNTRHKTMTSKIKNTFSLSSSCVLCTLCFQFLWIVHLRLPLWYSPTLIVSMKRLRWHI